MATDTSVTQDPPTHVRVVARCYLPLQDVWMETDWSSPGCTADCFEPGLLTITHVASDTVVQRFGPTQWRSATVYHAHMDPEFTLENPALRPERAS